MRREGAKYWHYNNTHVLYKYSPDLVKEYWLSDLENPPDSFNTLNTLKEAKARVSFHISQPQQVKQQMKSSNTSSWDTYRNNKLSNERGIGREALITTSSRELVEFYWTNRKKNSSGYLGFPRKMNDK